MNVGPVLVVEDDIDTRDLLTRRIAKLGHEVVAAATGEEAIDLATRHHPSLIVVDIGLPGIDGWEVVRRLRARPDTAAVRVLVVSAIDPTDGDPPVDGYVVKPFRGAHFDHLLSRILDARGAPVEAPRDGANEGADAQ
ncbi:MAG: response regulator transcription factor [Acidimicrobiales bacterium]